MNTIHKGRAHETLRRATSAAHHAIDHHPLMQRLTGPGLTRALYAQSLAAMYRPHIHLERQVHESSHHKASGLKLSPRAALLGADLTELGRPVSPVSHIRPDPLESRAAWWGRLYVLEGSRQGGAVIGRRIHSSLGDTVPTSFFTATVSPARHEAMLTLRECQLGKDADLELAVASARAAFAAYRADLDAFEGRERGVDRVQGE